MKKIGQRLFCPSILLLLLFFLTGHGPARADEIHASCSNGEFDFNDASPNRAEIPGANTNVDTVSFESRKDPLALGDALAFESGKKIYYLRDSTRPGMPLPAHLDRYFRLGDLLVVGGCEGASSCNGWLFLFKIEDGVLKLLDTWENEFLGRLLYDFYIEPDSWRAANGGALFRLNLPYLRFSFYVKATPQGFFPVFEPSAYESFCESTEKKPMTNLGTLRQSCVCTFILEKDRKKARQECRAKIDRYYGSLIRKAATFPDRRMTYEQYHDYLSPKFSEGWEYEAIEEAFEGPRHELAGRADLVKILQDIRDDDFDETVKIFVNFSRIRKAFRPEGKVSLAKCDNRGGAK